MTTKKKTKPKQVTIYKTIIQIEILHPDKVNWGNESLSGIMQECDDGEWSCITKETSTNKALKGKKAVSEIHKQGSDTEFFQMDNKGNELDEDFDEED